jgi:hypothetical protein
MRGGEKQKTVCLLIENGWYNEEFSQKPWNHSGVTRMKALAHSQVKVSGHIWISGVNENSLHSHFKDMISS